MFCVVCTVSFETRPCFFTPSMFFLFVKNQQTNSTMNLLLLILVLLVFLKQPFWIHASSLSNHPIAFSFSAPLSSPLISPVSSSMAAFSPGLCLFQLSNFKKQLLISVHLMLQRLEKEKKALIFIVNLMKDSPFIYLTNIQMLYYALPCYYFRDFCSGFASVCLNFQVFKRVVTSRAV